MPVFFVDADRSKLESTSHVAYLVEWKLLELVGRIKDQVNIEISAVQMMSAPDPSWGAR